MFVNKGLDKTTVLAGGGNFKNEIVQKSIRESSRNASRDIQMIIDTRRQIHTARNEIRDIRVPMFMQDAIQEKIVERMIKGYNDEVKKFNSPIIHLGLLLKNTITEAGRNPLTYLT